MSNINIEEPFINPVSFNKEKYNSLSSNYSDDIHLIIDKTKILKNYNLNIERMCSAKRKRNLKSGKNSKKNILIVKQNIEELLIHFPQGLQLEKFSNLYQLHYACYLNPLDYNFKDVIDMIEHFKDICQLNKIDNDFYVISTKSNDKSKEVAQENIVDIIHSERKLIPEDILQVFKIILESHGGGIALDILLPEYEFRSGKKINLADFGLSSIFELVSFLGPKFKVCNVNGCQSVVYDSDKIHKCPCETVPADLSKAKTDVPSKVVNGRFLSNEVLNRLAYILIEEFPEGLTVNELVAAYKGFHDAYSEDLNPTKYGLHYLEELLAEENEFVRIVKEFGKVVITAGAFYQERLITKEPSLNVVSPSSSFDVVDVHSVEEKSFVEVIVADVYNPCRFWVIKRGKENSIALDDLMDRMLEFYASDLGTKFIISTDQLVNLYGAPVAALYQEDANYYRAIVLSREDVQRVKLFYIDYGTTTSAPVSSLRFLHKKFFDFPAQAIKSSLYGIEPMDGRSYWPKNASSGFLSMSKDKDFVAYVHKNEEGEKLQLTLYDTTGEQDVNINFHLVKLGLASFIKDPFMDSTRSIEQMERKFEELLDDANYSCDQNLKSTLQTDVGSVSRQKPSQDDEISCSIDEFPRLYDADVSLYSICSKESNENVDKKKVRSKKRTICPSNFNVSSFSFRSMINSSSLKDKDSTFIKKDIVQFNQEITSVDESEPRGGIITRKVVTKGNILDNSISVGNTSGSKSPSHSEILNNNLLPRDSTYYRDSAPRISNLRESSPQDCVHNHKLALEKFSNFDQGSLNSYESNDESPTRHSSVKESTPLRSNINYEPKSLFEKNFIKDFKNFSTKNDSSLLVNLSFNTIDDITEMSDVADYLNPVDWDQVEAEIFDQEFVREETSLKKNHLMNDSLSSIRNSLVGTNNSHSSFSNSDSIPKVDQSNECKMEASLKANLMLMQTNVAQRFDTNETESKVLDDGADLNNQHYVFNTNKITSSVHEVFYSEEEDSTVDPEDGDQDVIQVPLPNQQVIHIIRLNSNYFIPIPELPLLLQPETLNLLKVSALKQQEDFPLLEITGNRYFCTFMLLAWKRVPYVVSTKGSIAKTLSLLSLQYLIIFMNAFANADNEDMYKEFIKSYVKKTCYDIADASPKQKQTRFSLSEAEGHSAQNTKDSVEGKCNVSCSDNKNLTSPKITSAFSSLTKVTSLPNGVKKKESECVLSRSASNVMNVGKNSESLKDLSLKLSSNNCVYKKLSALPNTASFETWTNNNETDVIGTPVNSQYIQIEIESNKPSNCVQEQNAQCSIDVSENTLQNKEKAEPTTKDNLDVTLNNSVKSNNQPVESDPKKDETLAICLSITPNRTPLNLLPSTTNSEALQERYPNNVTANSPPNQNHSYEYANGNLPPANLAAYYYRRPSYFNTSFELYPVIETVPSEALPPMQTLYTREYHHPDGLWHPYARYPTSSPFNIFRGYFPYSNGRWI